MADKIPVFAVDALFDRGDSKDGEYGVLGCVAPTGEKFRLAIRHDMIDPVELELAAVRQLVQGTRKKLGKQKGPVKFQARKISRIGTSVDRTMARLHLHLTLDGGAEAAFGLDLGGLDQMIEKLRGRREELASVKPPRAN